MKYLLDLIKDANGWVRLAVGLIVAGWVAGSYWANLKTTLKNHDDRIVKLEIVTDSMKSIEDKLDRALRIRR